MLSIIVVHATPIPVGHRVEITWHEEVQRGLVPSQERTDHRPHQPVILDLDTGVEYATDWGFGHGGRSQPDAPGEVEDAPLEGFRVMRRVVGVLRACRVVTLRATPRYDVQTHLQIDVDTDERPASSR